MRADTSMVIEHNSDPAPSADPSPRPARRKRKWAEHELGELLGRAWGEDRPPSSTPWEVERMPSEAEGGVVGLLLGDQREASEAREDGPAPGRAQLNDMIDRLPSEAPARVTAADVDLDDPTLAPPVVWFWGDDDIYPGKVPGVAQPVGAKRTRRRR